MTNKQLYEDLEELRVESPVLWALLAGKRTVNTIADHLIIKRSTVIAELQELVADGAIAEGQYMGRQVYKVLDPHFKALADFAWRFRQQLKK